MVEEIILQEYHRADPSPDCSAYLAHVHSGRSLLKKICACQILVKCARRREVIGEVAQEEANVKRDFCYFHILFYWGFIRLVRDSHDICRYT